MNAKAQTSHQPKPPQDLTPARAGLLQRECACGSATTGLTEECAECGRQSLTLHRHATGPAAPAVPPIVHDVLRSSGQPLASATRSQMEARFGHDFKHVRVHADARAAESAQALTARAYTAGSDIVFGAGQYAPHTERGTRLLAHELTHVVQQAQTGSGLDAEARAKFSAEQIVRGGPMTAARMGGAPPGLYRDGDSEGEKRNPPSKETPPLRLDLNMLPSLLPQPPSLLSPPQRQPFIQMPSFKSATPPLTFTSPSVQLPPSLLPQQPGPALAPTTSPLAPTVSSAPKGATAALPDPRLSVFGSGQFSIGLRLGLPGPQTVLPGTPPARRPPEPLTLPGAGPSSRAVTEYQFEIMDQQLSGKLPKGFDAIDKAELIKVLWGIASTHIVPDVAQSIARKLAKPAGPSQQFDAVLLGDFKGVGLSLKVQY